MFPPIFQTVKAAQQAAEDGSTLSLNFEGDSYGVRSVKDAARSVSMVEGLLLLGTDPIRLFPWGEAPEGVAMPYAVWQLVSGSPENYLAGRPDMDGFTLQIDVYASTGSSARAVGAALRDAIELTAYIVRWGGESKDEATGRYRLSFDCDWYVHR